MPTRQPAATPLGTDILLARHGDRIVRWEYDNDADVTRALLPDGTWDSAPNHLEYDVVPSPVRDASLATLAAAEKAKLAAPKKETPAAKAARWMGDYREDRLPVKRSEVRWLGKISLIWVAASSVIAAGLAYVTLEFGDPATLVQMMSGPGF